MYTSCLEYKLKKKNRKVDIQQEQLEDDKENDDEDSDEDGSQKRVKCLHILSIYTNELIELILNTR